MYIFIHNVSDPCVRIPAFFRDDLLIFRGKWKSSAESFVSLQPKVADYESSFQARERIHAKAIEWPNLEIESLQHPERYPVVIKLNALDFVGV
jgi:hypothetical protein